MRVINWNACEAACVRYDEAGDWAISLICDLGMHCPPEDASAEHRDPSGVRWRYPEDEAADD